jgi:hypothetical protein
MSKCPNKVLVIRVPSQDNVVRPNVEFSINDVSIGSSNLNTDIRSGVMFIGISDPNVNLYDIVIDNSPDGNEAFDQFDQNAERLPFDETAVSLTSHATIEDTFGQQPDFNVFELTNPEIFFFDTPGTLPGWNILSYCYSPSLKLMKSALPVRDVSVLIFTPSLFADAFYYICGEDPCIFPTTTTTTTPLPSCIPCYQVVPTTSNVPPPYTISNSLTGGPIVHIDDNAPPSYTTLQYMGITTTTVTTLPPVITTTTSTTISPNNNFKLNTCNNCNNLKF